MLAAAQRSVRTDFSRSRSGRSGRGLSAETARLKHDCDHGIAGCLRERHG